MQKLATSMAARPGYITRDLSWLSFNERVLQEAKDPSNHIYDRLRFLGIFSNNLDEFFRVRVASLNRMSKVAKVAKQQLEEDPDQVLARIQDIVMTQQVDFDYTFSEVLNKLEQHGVRLINEHNLKPEQQQFVQRFFEEKLRSVLVPLMIESMPQAPALHDKSIYLACVLGNVVVQNFRRYALIEIPTQEFSRFIILPSKGDIQEVILLEDIIRYNLPNLFAPFGFDRFLGYIIKITRDAELDFEADEHADLIESFSKSLKNRKKGRATRFVYDRDIDVGLFNFLTRRLNLSKQDNLIPGGRIHNFKDFMNFPRTVFRSLPEEIKTQHHPFLQQPCRIMDVLDKEDILLHFPYQKFDSLVDMLREAAIDPFVYEIKITAYRLARNSKIVNALINAARNGKMVTVILELKARFDEEANLNWKERLEDEGVRVFVGFADMKIHAKIGLIKKREFNKQKQYAFIATGNLNEHTANFYGDHCLLTSKKILTKDVERIFNAVEKPKPDLALLKQCKNLVVSPVAMRAYFTEHILQEIRNVKTGKEASIIIKLNSLVDRELISRLYDAAHAGVKIHLIIRGICCAITDHKYLKGNLRAISIVDDYLEHARVFVFHNNGKPKVYISSADWMIRNLDHRVEAATPIRDAVYKQQLIDLLNIQLSDNIKARNLDNEQRNHYVSLNENVPLIRSQQEIAKYLSRISSKEKEVDFDSGSN